MTTTLPMELLFDIAGAIHRNDLFGIRWTVKLRRTVRRFSDIYWAQVSVLQVPN